MLLLLGCFEFWIDALSILVSVFKGEELMNELWFFKGCFSFFVLLILAAL